MRNTTQKYVLNGILSALLILGSGCEPKQYSHLPAVPLPKDVQASREKFEPRILKLHKEAFRWIFEKPNPLTFNAFKVNDVFPELKISKICLMPSYADKGPLDKEIKNWPHLGFWLNVVLNEHHDTELAPAWRNAFYGYISMFIITPDRIIPLKLNADEFQPHLPPSEDNPFNSMTETKCFSINEKSYMLFYPYSSDWTSWFSVYETLDENKPPTHLQHIRFYDGDYKKLIAPDSTK